MKRALFHSCAARRRPRPAPGGAGRDLRRRLPFRRRGLRTGQRASATGPTGSSEPTPPATRPPSPGLSGRHGRSAAGGFCTLALKSDGTVWFLGEITLQHTTPHGTPDPVSTPGAGRRAWRASTRIAAGHRHFLALDADTGDLFAWGHNGSGQVGNGSLLDVTTPVAGPHRRGRDGGRRRVLARGHNQTASSGAWGRNTHGQLGLGDTADRPSPPRSPASPLPPEPPPAAITR